MLEGSDFYEGIRAALIDKDKRPKWNPETMADLDEDEIARYFAPAEGAELDWE
jgi:hypothetical protein